jgi:squalene-hopene/tetraprenyl-beta-curcumene cyclase
MSTITPKGFTELADNTALEAPLPSEQTIHAPVNQNDSLSKTINRSGTALLEKQQQNSYWVFDLEADTTIPAEYIFLQYFMGTVNKERETRLAEYILSRQQTDGSWSLYDAGPGNISATVKAYMAMKIAGKDPASEPMKKARSWILSHGGAENANVFTRITLATFGQIPWRTVPALLAEIIWLPKWFFFSLDKVSYWSRCVIVPLLILFTKKPVHELTPEQGVAELFLQNPNELKHIDKVNHQNYLRDIFVILDRVLKIANKFIPGFIKNTSVNKTEKWVRNHMRGEGGIGAIFPAMANAVMALKVLGYDMEDPDMKRGYQAIEDLVLENETETYVQPCVSPVWDTCLTVSALSESGIGAEHPAIKSSIDWMFEKQVMVRGDWSSNAPHLDSGGWAFQFENDFYPDVDDTSMVVMAMLRAGAQDEPANLKKLTMAVNWVIGMQNSDGGWGAFDIGNDYEYLNKIPFADHGALEDPSTSDLTGRCIEMFAMLGYDRTFPPVARGLEFLRKEQEDTGAWYGRWGVNYLYGTWAVLVALGALGEDPRQTYIQKAVAWFKDAQNSDGGWGEDCNTYDDPDISGRGISTASQTAWALLGLMAVDEVSSEEVERGVQYLIRNQEASGDWKESPYTGTGFPRVFYLRYHGYSHYFPVWALGVYRQMKQGNKTRQDMVCDGDPVELGPLPAVNT